MNDKDYRYIASRCSQYHESYLYFIRHSNENVSKKLWFYLMGLVETEDMINER